MAEIIRKNLNLILLSAILILAIFLRVWHLSSAPPELFGDELDVGYQAYSILKTGRDLQDNFLPTYFQSLAEFRAPLYIYSTVPFIATFGLNEWGVRLAAAFWGVLGVLAIYFLVKKLFSNDVLALTSALFLAISPWHLQYSRAGFEATLILLLLVAAVYFFLSGFEKSKVFIISAFLFALMPYTYSTGALFMPLFVLSLLFIFRKQIRKFKNDFNLKLAVGLFLVVLAPFVLQFVSGTATSRFQNISVAVNPEITKNINLGRQIDQSEGAFFHNKPLSFLFESSRNYLWAFSPQFLFSDGDPISRHSIGQMGEFYWVFLPFLLVGVYFFLKGSDISIDKKLLIFSWLLLAPLPAALTYDGAGHATRLFLLLPPLIILGAFGANEIFRKPSESKIRFILACVVITVGLFNLITYLHRYYVHYPMESWRWWQTGYKEAIRFINENENDYDRILINNTYEPSLIRFLFYSQYDPKKFHARFTGDEQKPQVLSGFDGFSLEDRYYFGIKTKDFSQLVGPKTLYLASARDESPTSPPRDVKVLKTILNPFGVPVFYLITGNDQNEK